MTQLRFALAPLGVLSMISGTQHLQFDKKTGKPKRLGCYQKTYNISLIFLAILLSLWSFHGKFKYAYKLQLPVLSLLNFLSQLSLTIGIILQGIIPQYFTDSSLCIILKNMIEADTKLSINCKKHYLSLRWMLWTILVIVHVCFLSVDLFTHYVWTNSFGFEISKYYLCEGAFIYQLTMHATQLYAFLILVKERFKFINELLPLAANGHCYEWISCSAINGAKIEAADVCPRFETSDTLVKKTPSVRELAKIHNMLYESSIAMNRYFGVLIVILCFQVFVMCTQSIYCGVVLGTGLQKVVFSTFDIRLAVFLMVCWALYSTSLLVLLTGLCEYTVNAANDTGIIAHKIILEDTLDPNTVTELTRLAQQVNHQNLQFSGWGLFNVNLTTLTQMIGAVSSYIIVALQFEGMTPSVTPPSLLPPH